MVKTVYRFTDCITAMQIQTFLTTSKLIDIALAI